MKNQQLPMTEARIRAARQILKGCRESKANLEKRIIEDEQWYRLRHWECMRRGSKNQVEPVSGWLFNAIAGKHADAMDNYPSPTVLPREEADTREAEMLTSVLPVVLEQADFEQVYDEVVDSKLKSGTGIYGVFWDGSLLGGLGDIAVRRIDALNLFWDSGINDIQDSRNVFHVELKDREELLKRYPQLEGQTESPDTVSRYFYDDRVDTSGKIAVVDWYYRAEQGGRQVLHYCKFAGDTLLYATENDPNYRERGWYDHGLYPFVFDSLFRVPGTPCGFGYIDVAKNTQEYIDRGNQAILQNLLVNARPRHFIRTDGSVNEAEYADMTRDFVHVQGNLGQDSIQPIAGVPLSGIYLDVISGKIDELKEVTGNRDISTGGTASGVTAASAIAAMQEAGSKLSRDSNRGSYRAFRKVCLMIVELMRQFYSLPRCFRITGADGAAAFVSYGNSGLLPKPQGAELGVDLGMRKPIFDIEIAVQKQSPYSRLSQNELALEFYRVGFFDPGNAPMALACLDMMDFDRRRQVMGRIEALAAAAAAPKVQNVPISAGKLASLGGREGKPEHYAVRRARQRVAESTSPV